MLGFRARNESFGDVVGFLEFSKGLGLGVIRTQWHPEQPRWRGAELLLRSIGLA